MNDNQMKPLQALELIMTRLQPSEDNIEKAKVEYETVKSALKEYELMKQTKFIVPNKKINEDDFEKLRNQRMFVGNLEACEIKPLFDEETTKKLKALEIINEKVVDIFYIKMCFRSGFYGFEHYNQSRLKKDQLTREEYELLKEVLKND